jgi:hypothetical protein
MIRSKPLCAGYKYPLSSPLNTFNAYGSAIIDSTLYVGLGSGNGNRILSFEIICGEVHIDTMISFIDYGYLDMASCKVEVPRDNCMTKSIELFHDQIKVYPTLFNRLINIDILSAEFEPLTLLITDYLGRPVYSTDDIMNDKIQVDLSDLPQGVYFIFLQGSQLSRAVVLSCRIIKI